MFKKLIALALLILSPLAQSQEVEDFNISGFISAAYFSDYIDNPIGKTDFSAAGLQISKQFGDFKGVAQVRAIGSNDYDIELNWAFLEYRATEDFYIVVGRFITSFYEYSQSSYVGNSYIWSRPPSAVYEVDFDSIDGISFHKEFSFADTFASFDLSYGSRKEPFIVGGIRRHGEVHDYLGLSLRLEDRYWTYKFNYSEAKMTYDTPFFSEARYQDSNPPRAFLESLDFLEDDYTSVSIYLGYERDWSVEFEIEKISVEDTYVTTDLGYYLSVGYQFDKFIPYVLATAAKTSFTYSPEEFKNNDPRPEWVEGYRRFYDIGELDYYSIGGGVRYDFSGNISVTVQGEYFKSNIEKDDEDKIIGSMSIDYIF